MTATEEFIRQHLTDNIRDLALHNTAASDVDLTHALQQIQGWQIACQKLPLWSQTQGIIYPPHVSMEQCSSQQAAEYKAGIIHQLPASDTMADLTGGFGVDAAILARRFRHLTFVEPSTMLCQLAAHNLPLLGIHDTDIINATCEQALADIPYQDLIMVDPSRRDIHGRKTILIADCTPDICKLQDLLLDKAQTVMVKLSPMLDISAVRNALHHLSQLHVLSISNQCKEIIALMSKTAQGTPQIFAVNITPYGMQQVVSEPVGQPTPIRPYTAHTPAVGNYLYEPNASIMKAGLFGQISLQYGLHQLHPNTHLYVSDRFVSQFPGRIFSVMRVCTLAKHDQAWLRQLRQANIAVRNFPSSVADLQKRLHLSDGGHHYLFATTIGNDNRKVIICCQKAGLRT